MRDASCVEFLQWALPQLKLRWPGFRKVRGQVRKRLNRRLHELELSSLDEYRNLLERSPFDPDSGEWQRLDAMCRISISRFYRDRGEFDLIREQILPELARIASTRPDSTLRIWSAGCASGEEPCTLQIICDRAIEPDFPQLDFQIIASDASEHMLRRAQEGIYPESSLKDFPATWIDSVFKTSGEEFVLSREVIDSITWLQQDIRKTQPPGTFDLIVCRHLVFTYFEPALQLDMLNKFLAMLTPDGRLMTGKQETLPEAAGELIEPVRRLHGVYRRVNQSTI
ncbi:MAG: protein-glutamate O-methyltransferase CheR [Planctomycetota bacterium]